MRKTAFSLPVPAACLALALPVASAQAQATRTWVSGVGDDANPCSRTAPCKTFAGAISKTAPSGEIDCLDSGGFGALTITKAIMIDCSATISGVLVAGTNGIVVAAGANDVVVLRGLDFNGLGTGLSGVLFSTGAALHVEKSKIRNFTTNGITFAPSAAAKLFVSDTTITNNGSGVTGSGIGVRPTGAGSARGAISNVRLNGNANGMTMDGSTTTGTSVLHMVDSVVGGSTSIGVLVTTPASGGGSTALMLDRTVVVNNPTGVSSTGAQSNIFMGGSTVFGSSTGLQASGGAQINSYKTNNVNAGNFPTDGAPTGSLNQN